MKIRKFNEDKSEPVDITVWIVVESYGSNELYIHSTFSEEILAADYIIKYVNNNFDRDFEPYFDDDGSRFFTSVDENKDYQKAIRYLRDSELSIDCIRSVIKKSPINRNKI